MDNVIHIRCCNNSSCRVDTFKATNVIPFNCCPVCLGTGIQLTIRTDKEEGTKT